MEHKAKIAIFGSGNGTNAQCIAEYFKNHKTIEIDCIVYNKKEAYIAERATNLGIASQYFGKKDFYESDTVINYLKKRGIDYIVLAGFLWLVPENMLSAYEGKIVNIHPALLPKYGGKGMYGDRVHEAVIAHHEQESGITIHEVDNHYDQGATLFQARCQVEPGDTPDSLAQKIHKLEHQHFPHVIESWIEQKEAAR